MSKPIPIDPIDFFPVSIYLAELKEEKRKREITLY